MPRFFAAGSNISKGIIIISGSDAEHIKVLRMKLGERLIVCDGCGKDHHCRLVRIGDGTAEAEIIETMPSEAEPGVRCRILAGMPKGERADFIVQKCTEAGAADITFFMCERSVSKPEGKSLDRKTARCAAHSGGGRQTGRRGVIRRCPFWAASRRLWTPR